MKLFLSLLLVTLRVTSKSCIRRKLQETGQLQHGPAWDACLSPPDPAVHELCLEVIAAGVPTPPLYSFAANEVELWAKHAVHYYCCVMRVSDSSFVYKTVFDYHQGCALASPFLQAVDPEDGSFLSAIAQYCPNSMAPSVPSDEDRGADLYEVAAQELPEGGAPLSNCGDPSENPQVGKLTILIPDQFSDGDIAHFPAFIGDDVSEDTWVSWAAVQDEHYCFSDFCSMEGVPGAFHPPYSLSIGRTFVVEGLNEAAMQAKKQELAAGSSVYQIINNNCSHKLLHILAAGMGCDAEIIPFYLPSALVNALETMDNAQEVLDPLHHEDIENKIAFYLAEAAN